MKKIIKILTGSRLYGTNTNDSDSDFKGIFIPNIRELLLNRSVDSLCDNTNSSKNKNNKDDVDLTYYSLSFFIKMLVNGDMVSLDLIHANEESVQILDGNYKYIWDFLRKNRRKLYTSNMSSYMGYIKSQLLKYNNKSNILNNLLELKKQVDFGINSERISNFDNNKKVKLNTIINYLPINDDFYIEKTFKNGEHIFYCVNDSKHSVNGPLINFVKFLDNKIENYGSRSKQALDMDFVDWKATSHALRVAYQLKSIYLNNDITFPLKEREFLLDVKLGKYKKEQIYSLLDELLIEINDLSKNFPVEKVDVDFFENFLISVYKREFLNF